METHPITIPLAQFSANSFGIANLPKSLDQNILIWTTRGQGRCIVDGVMRGAGAHNAIFIPAGTMFSLDMNKTVFGFSCLMPRDSSSLVPQNVCFLRIRDVSLQTEFTNLFETMQREQGLDRPFGHQALGAYAELLLVWLNRALGIQDEKPVKPSAAQRLVTSYARLVERDYASGAPMADYAQALNVTPTHLTRCCHNAIGMTASDFLTKRVLSEILRLTGDTNQSFKVIAENLGFRSAAYFSRFVLKHTGRSPSALRKAPG